MELKQASRQWSSRPDDQRFTSLHEMGAMFAHQRSISRGAVVSSKQIEILPDESDPIHGLSVRRKNGEYAYNPTNWSFGQLCTLADTPAGFMRKLDCAPLVSDILNLQLAKRTTEDVGLYLRKNGVSELVAATGPNYGRVYNSDICDALIRNFGDGVSGDWKVPGEFGIDVEVTEDNTTLYASDRDMFVYLADEKNRIHMNNRRSLGMNKAHSDGSLARGFFVWNSEVGSATLGIASFLFDFTCMNRIVWGAQDFREIKFRHSAGAPDKFLEQIVPVLDRYSHGAAAPVEATIAAAQAAKLDDTVADFLAKRRYSAQAIARIQQAHEIEEQRPMETLWDVVTGITAHAKTIAFQDERVSLERDAGKVLDLVAVR